MPTKRPLTTYHRKRKFVDTPEPKDSTREGGGIYVVQKHDATRLHYDFRLEHDGALLSWAVPKEPSTDPSVKRLAVRVEDHPIDYATFEGTIPKGNYGAGTVEIWDRGSWDTDMDVDQALKEGELKFHVHGERLNGKWVLVRMGPASDKENWLLIKERESEIAEAKPAEWNVKELPRHQLAELRATLPQEEGWQFEIKWDGYRIFAILDGKTCEIKSRGGNKLDLPDLEKRIQTAFPRAGILDGEIVGLNEQGRSNFSLLQHYLTESREKIQFVAFDVIRLEDQDLRNLPLKQRRAILEQTWQETKATFISPLVEGSPKSIISTACHLKLEGIVAKRVESRYEGKRSSDWIKVKCRQTLEAKVVGFTLLQNSDNLIGALLLANDKGKYIGRVGSGFNTEDRGQLFKELEPLTTKTHTVTGLTGLQRKGVRWVAPKLRVVVEYADITTEGILRQASYQNMANEIEKPKPAETSKVKLSSPGRVVDKESGSTKGDVFEFYSQISGYLMPFLKDRFISMLRCPDGADGECFFQKHLMAGKYKSMTDAPDGDDRNVKFKNEVGILEAVQMGVMEFHPWGSKLRTLEKPDQLILDLDPGDGMEWSQVLEGAEFVKQRMESIGIEPFYKLSGGKGVHLLASIKPELEWAEAKAFCKSLAEQLSAEKPKLFVSVSTKEKRKGKIYLDYLRNGRGATAVAPYTLRARANLPVAMPLTWDELKASKSADQFHIGNAMEFLENRLADPWADFAKSAVSLKRILRL